MNLVGKSKGVKKMWEVISHPQSSLLFLRGALGNTLVGAPNHFSVVNLWGHAWRLQMKRNFSFFVTFKKKIFKSHFSFFGALRGWGCYLSLQEHGWFNKSENLSTVSQTGRQQRGSIRRQKLKNVRRRKCINLIFRKTVAKKYRQISQDAS